VTLSIWPTIITSQAPAMAAEPVANAKVASRLRWASAEVNTVSTAGTPNRRAKNAKFTGIHPVSSASSAMPTPNKGQANSVHPTVARDDSHERFMKSAAPV
jgi:hypothetical protein